MAAERSRYQERIIKNYYRNIDSIAYQKATECVTELYLTEGKKREQVWKRLIGHFEKLEIPADQIAHLREQDNPEMIVQALKKFA